MSDHELGSGPIQDEYQVRMNALARVLDGIFNGDARDSDRKTGFVLLVFPYGEVDGRCKYISNGADRRDVINLLRELANRFDSGVQ